MVNIEDFIKRLEIILDYYSLNASSFADKIGVQRSSLSHLLSGRNKPSLDFILKILEVFPDVDLYWILNGKGNFPKNNNPIEKKEIEEKADLQQTIATLLNEQVITDKLFSSVKNVPAISSLEKESQTVAGGSSSLKIDKIVIFYNNGTFKSYVPD